MQHRWLHYFPGWVFLSRIKEKEKKPARLLECKCDFLPFFLYICDTLAILLTLDLRPIGFGPSLRLFQKPGSEDRRAATPLAL